MCLGKVPPPRVVKLAQTKHRSQNSNRYVTGCQKLEHPSMHQHHSSHSSAHGPDQLISSAVSPQNTGCEKETVRGMTKGQGHGCSNIIKPRRDQVYIGIYRSVIYQSYVSWICQIFQLLKLSLNFLKACQCNM